MTSYGYISSGAASRLIRTLEDIKALPGSSIRRELVLLVITGIFITSNQVQLILVQNRPWRDLWIVLLWAVCAVTGLLILKRLLPERDPYLYPAVMLLTGWGLNLVDRLLPDYTNRQSGWMVLCMGVLLVICALPGDLRWLRRYRYSWLMLGLILLGITIVIGVNPSGFGPRLWLGFRGYFFQPSELLKILLVVFLASYMAYHQRPFHMEEFRWHGSFPSLRFLGPIFLMSGLCLVMLIWQRDLGAAAIFFLIFLLMLYIASGQIMLLFGGVTLLILAGVGAYFFVDIVAFRVDIWHDPWRDADNTSFQIVQSLLAVADGGLIGSGVGQGIPTFIPVVHTDFAYAAIVEEWGLMGAVSLMGVLLVIILRGIRAAALLQHKPFHAYLAAGLSIMLAVQSLMIISGALNLIPLTGVTLPFVSYGGSSLLTSYLAVGLLLRLTHESENQDVDL